MIALENKTFVTLTGTIPTIDSIDVPTVRINPNVQKPFFPAGKDLVRDVEVQVAKSSSDFERVSQLRSLAYSAAGKITDVDSLDSDPLDRESRVLMFLQDGFLVATVRIFLCEEGCHCETESYVDLPKSFPKASNRMEVSRLVTHPSFRNGSLLCRVFEEIMLVAANHNRRFIIGGATGSLKRLYKRIGGQPCELHYSHTTLGGLPHQIFIWDLAKVYKGQGLDQKIYERVIPSVEQKLNSFPRGV